MGNGNLQRPGLRDSGSSAGRMTSWSSSMLSTTFGSKKLLRLPDRFRIWNFSLISQIDTGAHIELYLLICEDQLLSIG